MKTKFHEDGEEAIVTKLKWLTASCKFDHLGVRDPVCPTLKNQCWVVFNFCEEPPVPVLKSN
jgi:hypothetical protein